MKYNKMNTLIPKNKKGGSSKNWIQKAVNPKYKGFCTPMTKSTCTPRRKALARTFKKMAKHDVGGIIRPDIQAQLDTLKANQQPQLTPLAIPQVTNTAPLTQPVVTPQSKPLSFGDAFKEARGKGLDKFS